MSREAVVERKTRETTVKVRVNLDGNGKCRCKLPLGFLSHMIATLAKHSSIDIEVEGEGDLPHHLAEDVGLTLGKALKKALKQGKGIKRFGFALIPMDDALAVAAVDISGRPYAVINLRVEGDVEGVKAGHISHFLSSLACEAGLTLHLHVLYGEDAHHMVEAAFKAFATALKQAITPLNTATPSVKGVVEL